MNSTRRAFLGATVGLTACARASTRADIIGAWRDDNGGAFVFNPDGTAVGHYRAVDAALPRTAEFSLISWRQTRDSDYRVAVVAPSSRGGGWSQEAIASVRGSTLQMIVPHSGGTLSMTLVRAPAPAR